MNKTYKILELDDKTEYPFETIKKQFYKLSIRYHPDKFKDNYSLNIQEKYKSIINAYNEIKYNFVNKSKKISNNHEGLKFLSKKKIKLDLDLSMLIKEKGLNKIFLENIDDEDKNNIKLYLDLNLSEYDIENQFKLLHPDKKDIDEIKLHKDTKIKIDDIKKQREISLNDLMPKKIVDNSNFNSQFLINKAKYKKIIKYNKPDNNKFYHLSGKLKTHFDIKSEEVDSFINPKVIINKKIKLEELEKLTEKEFSLNLKKLIKLRDEI